MQPLLNKRENKHLNVNQIRTYITKVITLVIAVQILNLSVYGGDFDPTVSSAHVGKIGEFNQIDCLLEYVAEIMLDHKDAFPENGSHNPNGKSGRQAKHSVIKMVVCSRMAEMPINNALPTVLLSYNQNYKSPQASEINPPPPKC
jgi:hypothetical protein